MSVLSRRFIETQIATFSREMGVLMYRVTRCEGDEQDACWKRLFSLFDTLTQLYDDHNAVIPEWEIGSRAAHDAAVAALIDARRFATKLHTRLHA